VPVPDGRRSVASEAKRGDNARRACEARLTSPGGGFFAQPVLRAGASEQEHAIATVLVTGAEDRAARANHGSKDKRLGTSLGKYELLMQVLPSLRPFEPLRSEGDLETSERNEILLLTVAEFIRRRPKSAGDLIKGDSVSGQRDKFGSDRGKHMIVQRGRWCHTDIDEIYSRASLGEHIAASVALSSSGGTRSLEQVVPGWAQPARFGR